MDEKEEMDFEKSMKKLENIVRTLEVGNVTLEESISLYEEGARLISLCKKKLKSAEKKVEEINLIYFKEE